MNAACIGITAARRAEEQASLVRSLGGVPVVGSCVGLDRPVADDALGSQIDAALRGRIDVAVFLTGVGAGHTFAAARRGHRATALNAALTRAVVVARGTKSRRALRRHGLEPRWIADPPEARAVVERLLAEHELVGRRVLVQCVGDDDGVAGPLRAAGAEVIEIHPYRVAPVPGDAAADLARRAAAGDLAAVTFTSPPAVAGFAEACDREGIEVSPLAVSGCLMVGVGPVTANAMRAHGIPVDVEPETPRMGAMYRALAVRLGARA